MGAAVQLVRGASASAEDLADLCREQLARYKVPSEFRFVSEFPRTPTFSSSVIRCHPPPRLADARRRACSANTWRIARAAIPKK